MKRTTISLPDDLATALEREAKRLRVPVSQFVREAIEAKFGWNEEGPREVPFAAIGASDSPTGIAEYMDSDEYKQELVDRIYADAFNRDP